MVRKWSAEGIDKILIIFNDRQPQLTFEMSGCRNLMFIAMLSTTGTTWHDHQWLFLIHTFQNCSHSSMRNNQFGISE